VRVTTVKIGDHFNKKPRGKINTWYGSLAQVVGGFPFAKVLKNERGPWIGSIPKDAKSPFRTPERPMVLIWPFKVF
jgi:hypothetical protein